MGLVKNMKIGIKIIGMLSLILVLMVIVAGFGIVKLSSIGELIKGVVDEDFTLVVAITDIASNQLEQDIMLERALRFGEILAAKGVAAEGLKAAEERFEKLARLTDEEIKKTEEMLKKAENHAATEKDRKELATIYQHLKEIDEHSARRRCT